MLAPCGASKGFEDIDARGGSGDKVRNLLGNVKWGSSVTPSMRGLRSSERRVALRVTIGWSWHCRLCDVKRVTLDSGAEIERPRSSVQRETWLACLITECSGRHRVVSG